MILLREVATGLQMLQILITFNLNFVLFLPFFSQMIMRTGFWNRTLNIKCINYLIDLAVIIEKCEAVIGEMDTGATAWQKRMANLEGNWESAREAIFHSVVCSFAPPSSPMLCCKCNRNEAMLRCRKCGIIQYLCVAVMKKCTSVSLFMTGNGEWERGMGIRGVSNGESGGIKRGIRGCKTGNQGV